MVIQFGRNNVLNIEIVFIFLRFLSYETRTAKINVFNKTNKKKKKTFFVLNGFLFVPNVFQKMFF